MIYPSIIPQKVDNKYSLVVVAAKGQQLVDGKAIYDIILTGSIATSEIDAD